jgi:hypothetical protein
MTYETYKIQIALVQKNETDCGTNYVHSLDLLDEPMEVTLDQLRSIQTNRYNIFKQDIDKLHATGNFCDLDIIINVFIPTSTTKQRIESFFEKEENRKAKEREEKAAKAERDRVKREAAAVRKAEQEKEDLKRLLKTTAKKLGVTVEIPE